MEKRAGWLLVILASIVLLVNLGSVPLLDPDEPVYAETAREMLLNDDWVSPRIYGDYWYDKPPMYYWLTAISFEVLGESEFASRLPSAVAGIFCVLILYKFMKRRFGWQTAFIAGLILLTSTEFYYLAKAAVTDMALCLFLTATLLAALDDHWCLAGISAGLAVVTKGPVGVIFPVAIGFCYWLVFERHRLTSKDFNKLLMAAVGCLVVALPWYMAMYVRHGMDFVDTFLGFNNMTRFTSPEHPDRVHWYYYFPYLIIGFAPWIVVIPAAVMKTLKSNATDLEKSTVLRFAVVWAVFIFIFFSVCQTKLVSYIFPMWPPLAILAGWYIGEIWPREKICRNVEIVVMTILILTVIGVLWLAGQAYPAAFIGLVAIGAVLLLTIVVLWYAVFCRPQWLWQVIAGGAGLTAIILFSYVVPALETDFSCRDAVIWLNNNSNPVDEVYVVKFLRPGLAWYGKQYGQEISTEADVLKVLATDNYQGSVYVVLRTELWKEPSWPAGFVPAYQSDYVIILKNNR